MAARKRRIPPNPFLRPWAPAWFTRYLAALVILIACAISGLGGGAPLMAMVIMLPPTLGGLGDTNLAAGSRAGTTVTASGTAHTKGSYSSLIDPTTRPSYGIWIHLSNVFTTATNTSMLVDIAYGPTGGGNEEILILDLDAGAAGPTTTGPSGKHYWFPVYIPSGVRVSARCQAVITSDTVTVAVMLTQDAAYNWSCGAVHTYGENEAASHGTSVTPASGSFGSWTQIGAGTDPIKTHRFWHVGYSIGTDTSAAAAEVLIEIGTGPDSSNVTTIGRFRFLQTSGESIDGPWPDVPVYQPVNAGDELWARIASAETEARRVIIYGCD